MRQEIFQNSTLSRSPNKALEISAITLGVLSSVYSIEHGIFEILQGNTVPKGLLIDAIGPDHEYFPGAMELAFTIIPNILITGIFVLVVGILGVIWAVAFIRKK